MQFTIKDLYNCLGKQEVIDMAESDVAKAIGYLQHKANQDVCLFRKYTFEDDMRRQNFILGR